MNEMDVGWTKRIQLRRISIDAFLSLRSEWGCTISRSNPTYTHLLIENPIVAPRYLDIVRLCAESPCLVRMAVRRPDNRGWFKPLKTELDEGVIAEVVDFAERDPRQINHFEAKFSYDPNVAVMDQACLEFTRHPPRDRASGLIVGYMLNFLRSECPLFSYSGSRASRCLAIADPRGIDRYQQALSLVKQ